MFFDKTPMIQFTFEMICSLTYIPVTKECLSNKPLTDLLLSLFVYWVLQSQKQRDI